MGGMLGGMFGGKGGDETQPPPVDTSAASASMNGMAEMMAGMMSSMQATNAQNAMYEEPTMPETLTEPVLERTADIDWTEKQSQLNQKMKADYNVDEARRKGRGDTVLTSPLLDEEEANVSGSILSGS